MKQAIFEFVVKRPRLIYVLVVLLTVLLGLQLPRISIDTDPENMLPAEQADRVFHNEVKQRFDLPDAIVLGAVNNGHDDGIYNVASLEALHRVTLEVLKIDGVIRPDLMALSVADNITQTGDGALRFEWMMREAPATAAQARRIREMVRRLPLLQNTLVSGDGRAAAVYVPIFDKDESYRIAGEIQAIIDRVVAEAGVTDDYHMTGLPVAEDTFGYEMFVQMGISAPLAGLMIFVLMWVFFRSFTLIVAPMILAMVTVIATMGLLIGLGHTVHIMSSMIPIFLMPIAVVDSVHIMSEFADTYEPGSDVREVIGKVLGHLFTPMLYTSVTSSVGFLSLALTPIPPVQVFGAFVAFGIMLAFVLTITFIPAYLVRMKPARLQALQAIHHRDQSGTILSRLLPATGRFAASRSRLLLALFIAVFAVSVAGITRIQINDNPVKWFKPDHRIRIADRTLNEHFAGTYDAHLVLQIEGEATGPAALEAAVAPVLAEAGAAGAEAVSQYWRDALDRTRGETGNRLDAVIASLDDELFAATDEEAPFLEALLAAIEGLQSRSRYFQQPTALRYVDALQAALMDSGYVGKTNALPDLVKTVNRELHSGGDQDYRLPDSVPGVAQALLQFQSSHRPDDLWHMVTPDYRSTVIWLQLESGDNQDMTRVMDLIDDFAAAHPPPEGLSMRWAGKTYLNVVWQDAMVAGMVNSLIGAFAVVFVMMIVLFRSLVFGILAMLPLTITITFIYGLIGWVGKDYDMPIAVLSALTLGLSVDFAIHFLERARSTWRRTGSVSETLGLMFAEPARAIARNAIVIAIGFTPLLLAPLMPYVTVGMFLAAIMAVSAGVTLVLLPALMSMFGQGIFSRRHGLGSANRPRGES